MRYLLTCHLLQGRATKWVVVLLEFDLECFFPKGIKALAQAALMTDLPPLSTPPPLKDDLPDDFLFIISTEYLWYGGILLYLCTQKFEAHLICEDK